MSNRETQEGKDDDGKQSLVHHRAARGMGLEFARARWRPVTQSSLRAATPIAFRRAFETSSNLLAVQLDVTRPADADAGEAAVERFGRIDVLINNAAASTRATSRS
jgi:NAD(P)-dependent dehydrogenase (short-subunit alcohol dehydrogenase family)